MKPILRGDPGKGWECMLIVKLGKLGARAFIGRGQTPYLAYMALWNEVQA